MDGLHMNSGSVLISTKRHGARKHNRNLSLSGSFECSKQSILSSMDKFVRTVQSMHGTILVPSRLRDMRLRPRLPDCQITMLAASSTGGSRLKNGSAHNSRNHNQTGQLKSKPLNSSSKHSHFHHHLHHHLIHNHLQDYHLAYRPYHSSSTSNSTNSLDSSTTFTFNSRLNYDPAEIPSALMNADLYNFYSMLYDVKQQLLWGPASGQSTIFTNYSTNCDLNQSNTSRFMMEKSPLHQLNSTMANCNLNNSDNSSIVQLANRNSNCLSKENRAESTCSSGYSSNSSTRNSTTNLSFIAQCSSPTSIANCNTTNSQSPLSTRPSSASAQNSVDDARVVSQCSPSDKINDSTVSSSSSSTASTTSSDNGSESSKLVESPQSKTPQSDSDLESELESDSILTDRTSEQITDQTQLLASAFRHHLQALHTILDQLTHSAEYLSRNYELDLDEIDDNYLTDFIRTSSQTSGLTTNQYASYKTDQYPSDHQYVKSSSEFQRLEKPNRSFREEIMDKINSKLTRSPNQTRCSSPSTNTLKSRFNRLRKKSSSSENSCQNDTNSITSTISLNSSLNLDLHKQKSMDIQQSSNNIDADPVFNGLVNEGDLIEHNGQMFNVANNNRDVENAWNFVKQLTSALRYLQDVVEKDILEQLSGAASILLEIVVSGYAKLRAHLIINEKSDLFIIAKNKMCSSLAELIKWSDAVLLYGDDALERTNVCIVVNSVKDAVESLVKLCVDKHQRKIKLHSSSLSEVTVSELNDQIDKLNLNNSFVNIPYRCKPTIFQPIDLNILTNHTDKSFNNNNFSNNCSITNCSSLNDFKTNATLMCMNSTEDHSIGGMMNREHKLNQEAKSIFKHQKSLPDLIDNRDCQASKGQFSYPKISKQISCGGQLGSSVTKSNSHFERNTELIFNAKLIDRGLMSIEASNHSSKIEMPNHLSNLTSNHLQNNVSSIVSTGLDTVPSIPPRPPAKSNQTMNYCNVAQIVETDKCNQISIEFAPPLPPKLPPKKCSSSLVNRKIDFNKMSDLKFDHHLNEKLSQNLNQQFDQFNNQTNRQLNRLTNQTTNQINKKLLDDQLPKNALLVSSNSVLDCQNKQSRQARSTENIKFRSNSLDSTGVSTKVNLESIVNEFADYDKQQCKHHSDNEVIRDFIQINKNLNEFNIGANSTNSDQTTPQLIDSNQARQSISSEQTNGCQFTFRRKKSSLSEATSSIVQLTKSEFDQYLDSSNDSSNKKMTNGTSINDSQSGQSHKRPSSQYDNLSLDEFSDNLTNICHPFSSATTNQPSTQHSSLNTMNIPNSLNLSWQSNKFSTSSSNQIDHFDPNHSDGSSNRSSDLSVSKCSKDNESESSYENQEDDLPPPIPPKNKNISVYCQLFSSYTAPPKENALSRCYRYSVHTVQEIYRSQATYQQVELSFNQQKEFHNLNNQLTVGNEFQQKNKFNQQNNRHRLTGSSLTTSSDDSMFSIDSFNSDSSKEINCLPLPPKNKNPIAIPEKPEAYRCKQIAGKDEFVTKLHHYSLQSTDQNLNEIKTAKLKHFDTLDFVPPDSPVSLQKCESGISSIQSISKSNNFLNDESTSEPNILDELNVQQYLIYKKETLPPTRETPKKESKKHQEKTLDFKDELQGGPVDALIVKATEVSSSRKKDFLFLEAFLATYRTFVSPTDLIDKLIYRFNRFIRLPEEKQMYAKNAFALLVRVVDDLCVTDCTNELMENLFTFFYSLILGGDLVLAKVLRNRVLEKVKAKRASAVVQTQKLLTCLSITTKQCSLLDFKSEHIAEQMTLFDNELFVKIEPSELLLWSRQQIEEPNLSKFTEHFNKMSYWVRSRIIEENEPREREKIAWKFIKVMKHLRKFNNFNSYLALLSALDSAPIRRLDWPKSVTETLNDYSTLIDPSSSFRTYRILIEETQPPSIPYIGLILQDLTFVHIGNKDLLPDDRSINFNKRWQIFNILEQLKKFRHSQYNFKKNEQIFNLFNNFDNYLSEDAVWQLSLVSKPKPKKSPKK